MKATTLAKATGRKEEIDIKRMIKNMALELLDRISINITEMKEGKLLETDRILAPPLEPREAKGLSSTKSKDPCPSSKWRNWVKQTRPSPSILKYFWCYPVDRLRQGPPRKGNLESGWQYWRNKVVGAFPPLLEGKSQNSSQELLRQKL
jgi:hypothetical protein